MSTLLTLAMLGGGIAIAKKVKDGSVKTTVTSAARNGAKYAVLSEVKEGKGSGAVAVSHITNNKQEAIDYAKDAAMAMVSVFNGSRETALWQTVSMDGQYESLIYGCEAQLPNGRIDFFVVEF